MKSIHLCIKLLLCIVFVQLSNGHPDSESNPMQTNSEKQQKDQEQLLEEIKKHLKNQLENVDIIEDRQDYVDTSTQTVSSTPADPSSDLGDTADYHLDQTDEQGTLQALKFDVDWQGKLAEREQAEQESRLFPLVMNNDQKYTCISPKVVSREEQLRRSLYEHRDMNPVKLIEYLLVPHQCVIRLDHYWTYIICHGKHLIQFHDESKGDGDFQMYVLGKYSEAEMKRTRDEFVDRMEELWNNKSLPVPTITVNGVKLPYIEWTFSDGQFCSLNQKPRTTKVKYVCAIEKKKEFLSLKEVATCQYEAIVALPQLCRNPAFAAPRSQKIKCAPDSTEQNIYPDNYFNFHKHQRYAHYEAIFDRNHFIILGKDLKTSTKYDHPMDRVVEVEKNENDNYVIRVNEQIPDLSKLDPNAEQLPPMTQDTTMERFLAGKTCLTSGDGWWKYEFCYGSHVKQFHEEKGRKGATILLGQWNLEEHRKELTKDESKRQVVNKNRRFVLHYYSNGDYCENTRKPRFVDVKLKCFDLSASTFKDEIQMTLVESSVCEYRLVLASPHLCNLVQNADEFGLNHDKLPVLL